jgi:hypothetical protein
MPLVEEARVYYQPNATKHPARMYGGAVLASSEARVRGGFISSTT